MVIGDIFLLHLQLRGTVLCNATALSRDVPPNLCYGNSFPAKNARCFDPLETVRFLLP